MNVCEAGTFVYLLSGLRGQRGLSFLFIIVKFATTVYANMLADVVC